ncbi:hypothetical protein BDP27DRAFT_1430504 [Rhodocollybia butyracea]|uniref:DUF6533 domain-containing protein n=1 Tax=Rhodocollybia butyracea TaxID=206335 RepID=A0A9P5PAT7_9AGAR|nr:hypothetical protein BDP27DRAFT_1430504 [Rhodocollybia butyracea]
MDIVSMETLTSPSVAVPLLAQRYLTAIGIGILVYDHLLTIGSEIELIWAKPMTGPNFIFLFVRYGVLGCQILGAYVMSGGSTNVTNTNENHNSPSSIPAALTGPILHLLLVGFLLGYGATVGFTAACLHSILANPNAISYDPAPYHTCLISEKPKLWPGIWASQIAFDLYLAPLILLNAVNRPRAVHVKLLSDFNRDGGMLLMTLFLARVLNLVLSALPNTAFMIVGFFFSWALINCVTCRLYLRVEQMKIFPQSKEHQKIVVPPNYIFVTEEQVVVTEDHVMMAASEVHELNNIK